MPLQKHLPAHRRGAARVRAGGGAWCGGEVLNQGGGVILEVEQQRAVAHAAAVVEPGEVAQRLSAQLRRNLAGPRVASKRRAGGRSVHCRRYIATQRRAERRWHRRSRRYLALPGADLQRVWAAVRASEQFLTKRLPGDLREAELVDHLAGTQSAGNTVLHHQTTAVG